MRRPSRLATNGPARRRRVLSCERLESREVPATLPSGFAEAAVATGLTRPTTMEFAPDGSLFIAEQGGTMEVWNGGSRVQADFFQNTPLSVDSSGERGLLGVAFDPNFASNRFVYVYYTTTAADHRNRVSRFTADASGRLALAGSERVVVDLDPHEATNHNGGAIHFGPDGKLYIAAGDNADGNTSQSLASRHGKILRINADGSIPADNPFVSRTTGANRAIWAMGLRNPYTFAFQPGTGTMFINDVGGGRFEEINRGVAGANFGWPTTEGDFPQTSFPSFARPIYAYAHGGGTFEGFAITGGAFYNPSNPGVGAFPSSYNGDYFFADFAGAWIHVLDADTRQVSQFATGLTSPVDLRVGPDGGLYYLEFGGGRAVRIASTNPNPPPPPVTPTPGLKADFFDLSGRVNRIPNLDGLTPDATRTMPSLFQAPTRSTWTGLNLDGRFADSFAARISGFLRVDTPGRYKLTLRSDDGSRLTLNGRVVLNNDGVHGPRPRTVTLNLTRGFHAIRVDYFEKSGPSSLALTWTGPNIRRPVVVPPTQFFQTTGRTAQAAARAAVSSLVPHLPLRWLKPRRRV